MAVALLAGCGRHDAGAIPDAGAVPDTSAVPDAGDCGGASPSCADLGTLESCSNGSWTSRPCPADTSCLDGSCVSSCVDACNLGETKTTGGGTLTCKLLDVSLGSVVAAGGGMEDRSRLYNSYLRQACLPAGQVAGLFFTAPDLQTVLQYQDLGDSALFTGTYLAAEAWRYKATGSPDALANMTALVQTIHMMWNVAPQSPGWLARYAAPSNSSAVLLSSITQDTTQPNHSNGFYDGQSYVWMGAVSRDQYEGAMLGYAAAYDVLTDESIRDLIRADMTTFVKQLMITRTLCPTINGFPCLVSIQEQYIVKTPWEPLAINLTTSGVSSEQVITGLLDFMPSAYGVYPQPAAAIQLTSAFEVALHVTADRPAWAADHDTIQAFFLANVDSWLQTARTWFYSANCGKGYFGNNIVFEPMFNLARLDSDPGRQAIIQGILQQNMWQSGVINDKNPWFAYIYAAVQHGADAGASAAVAMGNHQLSQFQPPPRVHVAVSNSFPENSSCPGNAQAAIDVANRVIGDFEWQRQPWQQSDPGVPTQVFPGVDYLAAYWLGRAEGFLQNDAPTECTQWLP